MWAVRLICEESATMKGVHRTDAVGHESRRAKGQGAAYAVTQDPHRFPFVCLRLLIDEIDVRDRIVAACVLGSVPSRKASPLRDSPRWRSHSSRQPLAPSH